jgi:hypothetical protein
MNVLGEQTFVRFVNMRWILSGSIAFYAFYFLVLGR